MPCHIFSLVLLLGGFAYYLGVFSLMYYMSAFDITPYVEDEPIIPVLTAVNYTADLVIFAMPLLIIIVVISENMGIAWVIATIYLVLGIWYSSLATFVYNKDLEKYAVKKWELDGYKLNLQKRNEFENEHQCCGYNGRWDYTWSEMYLWTNALPESCMRELEPTNSEGIRIITYFGPCAYWFREAARDYIRNLATVLSVLSSVGFGLFALSGAFAIYLTYLRTKPCNVATCVVPPCPVPACIAPSNVEILVQETCSNFTQANSIENTIKEPPCNPMLYRYM